MPEEYGKPSSGQSNAAVADPDVLCSSLYRYFRYNHADLFYVLPYEPIYARVVESMCADGWIIELHCGASGELFYAIPSKIKSKIP
ncbi:hypothetical protein [Sphingobacterium wenxiniae]|uniref:hypothetical protein n=1 Tax=Sphingobacterium wenxiniae TaxID=683125 RepID=UPI000B810DDF|nr:hypothetical protein [Sphingobacterium wenxiniae]